MCKKLATAILFLAASSACASTQLLVPAYFDPSVSNDWNVLASSVSPQVPITAIFNPDSGPVPTVDPAYTAALSNFQAAGGKVIAYVYSSYGNRSLSAVEQDINTYKSEYPNIDGIFVDEMANTSGKVNYFRSLYSYIKGQNPTWQVVGNPGTDTLSSYLTPTPAADILVTFENGTGYSTYTPPAWENSLPASNFANIVYSVPNAATMQSELNSSPSKHAANVYFTESYSSLPSYWSQEVAGVRSLNLKSTYSANSSGDYNLLSNWSWTVPNAVDAEADFLGAITSNRTVYSDTAITLGKIIFNNSNTYVLAGAGELTMQSSTGSALVSSQAGTQKITLPMTIASDTVLNADAGSQLVITGPVTINPGKNLSESGSGQVVFQSSVTVQGGAAISLQSGTSIAALNLQSASTVSVIASSARGESAIQMNSLSLSPTSKLDLNGQDLIVHNGNSAAITSLMPQLQSANDLTALGVILNDAGGSPIFDNFGGQPVSLTDVLIRSTIVGDANLDGVVNSSDFARINFGFANHLNGWFNGDFNNDGIVNSADYALIDAGYNLSLSQTVPEPGILSCLLVLAGLFRLPHARPPSIRQCCLTRQT